MLHYVIIAFLEFHIYLPIPIEIGGLGGGGGSYGGKFLGMPGLWGKGGLLLWHFCISNLGGCNASHHQFSSHIMNPPPTAIAAQNCGGIFPSGSVRLIGLLRT
jgi:hypothetical protein